MLEDWFVLAADDQDGAILPAQFTLHQNYPNPFNPATLIRFDLPTPAHVKLEVFNLLGQRVAKLVDESMKSGRHSVIWDGKNQSGEDTASGVYLYRLTAGDYTKVRRMTILR